MTVDFYTLQIFILYYKEAYIPIKCISYLQGTAKVLCTFSEETTAAQMDSRTFVAFQWWQGGATVEL